MFMSFLSFMLGLSLLLPWNALLKSLPYVMSRVPEEWRSASPLILTLSFSLGNFGTLLLLTLTDLDSSLLGCWKRRGKGVVGSRLHLGLMGCGTVLILACFKPVVELFFIFAKDEGEARALASMPNFIIYWMLFICMGILICLLQRSVYPLMTMLPDQERLVPMMLGGQAAAGIFASFGSFMLVGAAGGDDAIKSSGMTLVYFGGSLLALLGTLLLYRRYEENKLREPTGKNQSKSPLTPASDEFIATAKSKTLLKTYISELGIAEKLIRPWPAILFLNFAVTLSIFPGWLGSSARSLSSSSSLSSRFFLPLTFLVFDVSDLVGKLLPRWGGASERFFGPKSWLALLIMPVGRLLFVPAFWFLPNMHFATTSTRTDVFYFMLLSAMALSSGWLNGICLINASRCKTSTTTTVQERRIGELVSLSISGGLMSGCLLSFLLRALI